MPYLPPRPKARAAAAATMRCLRRAAVVTPGAAMPGQAAVAQGFGRAAVVQGVCPAAVARGVGPVAPALGCS